MAFVLEIKAGAGAGRVIALRTGESVTVGRAAGKAKFAVAQDTFMSGVHFAVECGTSGCRVVDRKSSNGTFLNGAKIQDAMLANGDEIKAGQTVFRVRIVADDKIASLMMPQQPASPDVAPRGERIPQVDEFRPASVSRESGARPSQGISRERDNLGRGGEPSEEERRQRLEPPAQPRASEPAQPRQSAEQSVASSDEAPRLRGAGQPGEEIHVNLESVRASDDPVNAPPVEEMRPAQKPEISAGERRIAEISRKEIEAGERSGEPFDRAARNFPQLAEPRLKGEQAPAEEPPRFREISGIPGGAGRRSRSVGSSRGSAFSVMGWSFPAAPTEWQVQEGFGLQRSGQSGFPSSVAVTEEVLGGITLQQFVELQIRMLRGYLRDPKIEVTMPPRVDGADESMGMDVRHSTKDGRELAYRHIYARSGSSVGILTVTTLASEFPEVIESLQPLLDGAAFEATIQLKK